MSVFGIDLGTTYSAIARVTPQGSVEIVELDTAPTTPSVVQFEDEQNIVVGIEAKQSAKVYPEHTVSLIKREMGQPEEESSREFFNTTYTPESISALILRHLIENAIDEVGGEKKAVITVPAYFGLREKDSTRAAGKIAGIDVIDIITEPVAAAISEGFDFSRPETVLVYDLGGGTFDCSIMEFTPDTGIKTLAVDGERELGGADWDDALYNLVLERFLNGAGANLDEDDDPNDDINFEQKLRTDVEDAKKKLSKKNSVRITVDYSGINDVITITRDDFDQATAHLLDRTLQCVDRTLELAQKNSPNFTINKYLLVGGSSRMPQVAQAVEKKYGWPLTKTQYDYAVAKGAAMVAHGTVALPATTNTTNSDTQQNQIAIPGTDPTATNNTMTISNLLSKAVGVRFYNPEQNRPYVFHLIEQNATLPASNTITAQTLEDGATSLPVQIFEQKGDKPSEDLEANVEITPDTGVEFVDLPYLPKGSPIELTMAVDNDGRLSFTGFEPTTNQTIKAKVTVSTLSEETIEKMTTHIGQLTLD